MKLGIVKTIIPKFMVIKIEDSKFKVKDLFDEYSDVIFDKLSTAIDLCRMRVDKVLNDKLTIFKLPFTKIHIIF
jgi:hypothetical protein